MCINVNFKYSKIYKFRLTISLFFNGFLDLYVLRTTLLEVKGLKPYPFEFASNAECRKSIELDFCIYYALAG